MPVVIVGPLAFDDVHAPAGRRSGLLGGSGAYAGIAAAKHGPAALVSIAGSDLDDELLEPVRGAGVDLAGLQRVSGRTLRWTGSYSEGLTESAVRNADLGVVDRWDPVVPEAVRDARQVLLANTDPAVQARALDQLRPDLVVLDTMDQWIRERRRAFEAMITRATIVSLNEGELVQLTGERDLVAAARLLIGRGPRAVVAKRGANGATLITSGAAYALPAYPIMPIDPTGAGDALAGAFVGRLARTGRADEPGLREALAAGMAAASFAVASFGVDALAAATIGELEARAAWLAERGGTAEAGRLYEGR
ncbi:MAG TPA: PfkB family carbohydrate kinase [Candidatus Saccharimonadales bacterium]|jgi:sugar/nucleoside kinase (ribokinase family)|nr:PfkB family carbohydrate kinase [Candidatus Saccharimonadales bacterium]